DRGLRMGVVRSELVEVRERYHQERRTDIMAGEDDIGIEDLIKRSITVITVTRTGYIKRQPEEVFRTQRRGGKGVVGMQTRDEDHLFTACTHDHILFFTNKGQMRWLKVYEIPEAQRAARGKAIVNLVDLGSEESVRAMITVADVNDDTKYLVFATAKGIVKKTP